METVLTKFGEKRKERREENAKLRQKISQKKLENGIAILNQEIVKMEGEQEEEIIDGKPELSENELWSHKVKNAEKPDQQKNLKTEPTSSTIFVKEECEDAEIERNSIIGKQIQTSSENCNDQIGLLKEFATNANFANNFVKTEVEAEATEIQCSPISIGEYIKCNWPGCEYQTKIIYKWSSMQTHWRVHTGESPYVCQQCGRSFKQSRGLKRHKRVHDGQGPYKCTECGQAFKTWSTLHKHQWEHTGERAK